MTHRTNRLILAFGVLSAAVASASLFGSALLADDPPSPALMAPNARDAQTRGPGDEIVGTPAGALSVSVAAPMRPTAPPAATVRSTGETPAASLLPGVEACSLIAGVVHGPFGEPLPEIVLSARPQNGGRALRTTSDDGGRFSFTDVVKGKRYTIRIACLIHHTAHELEAWGMLHDPRSADRIHAEPGKTDLAWAAQAGNRDVAIRLRMRTGFMGTVVKEGIPVPRFRLSRGGAKTTIGSTVRDARGRFFIVCDGGAGLELAAASRDASAPPCRFTSVPGQITRGIVLRLSERGVIVGTVRHGDGKAIRGAQIIARDARTDEILDICRAKGDKAGVMTFRLSDLPTGTVRLEADSYDFLPWRDDRVHVIEGQEVRRDIVVRDGGTIALTAQQADGKPVVEAAIVLKHLDSGVEQRVGSYASPDGKRFGARAFRTDANGKFEQSALAPGAYEVSVVVGGRTTLERTIVQAGDVAALDIRTR